MAGPREKLPKFHGDGSEDPIRHCKTCETIWMANGVTDADDWVRQFPATLRGVAIDWFSDTDPQKLNTWENVKKEFIAEFRLLRDDNEIVAEIYSTKQGKNETVRTYARKLKELIGKMESQPADGLKKRWFVEGLRPTLKKKMKIVPPASYSDAYTRAMDLESEQKTSKKKKHKSSDSEDSSSESSSSDEESDKKVKALQKDMLRMMKEFKNLKKNPDTVKGELWCTDCKEDGHTKGSCPKKQFCDICQVAGHSLKECPFNLKTKGHQQVLLTQEASNNSNNAGNDATPGGYRNNNRRGRGGNNNNNNNNGGRSRMQYDASGRPMIQCRACNLWGHFARDCTTKEAPQLLCRWCGPGDHEDSKCPKQSVNLLSIETSNENVLAITREQARKTKYPNAEEEKERLQKARAEIEKQMIAEKSQVRDTTVTPKRNLAEQSMVKQIMQMEVPVKLNDLLLTMPQLRTAIINMTPSLTEEAQDGQEEAKNNKETTPAAATDPMLLALTTGRHPAVVEMGIRGTVLTDTIVDGGSGVNVLPEDIWKKLGQPTLWPPTFQLLTADQHGIKPLGTLMAQPVTIGTQPFLLDFVVIPLKRRGYDAILGRGWLVQAKVKHDWKRNTLSMEKGGRKFIIDLHTQMVGEEAASSDSEGEGENDDEGKRRMEPDDEGVLRLEGGTTDDDLDSVNGLLHWQMEDYEVFPSCNILNIEEGKEDHEFPKEYTELKEGEARMDETPAHTISKDKPIKYEEPTVKTINLGDEENPKNIFVGDDWNPVLKAAAFRIFMEYKDVFAWTYKDLKGVPPELCVHRIPLIEGAVPVRKRPYRMNKNYAARVTEEIDRMLEAGIIFKVQTSEWVSPIVISLKKDATQIRICVDFRCLNAVTIKDPFPIPFTDSILEEVAGHEIYSFMDGFSGYNQISIAEEDKLKTTFIVEDGVYAYNRMPFGLCNAPATFQRIILYIFDKMSVGNFKAFLDDWSIFSSEDKHLAALGECMERCRRARLALNPKKCRFMVPQGRLLGHIVCKEGLKTDPDKVRVILEMPPSTDVSEVKSFLGHLGYYRRFIKNYAKFSYPLDKLTCKDEPYRWEAEQNEAFEGLKTRLVTAPILAYPNWDKEFHVHVDASNYAIGATLAQTGNHGLDHPVYFASRLLSKAERNYSTTEREALGMVYAVQKFRHYLLATPFVFYVDHQALLYLVNKPIIQGRISRWLLLLQEFTFKIVVRPGKSHVSADHLSRIKSGEPPEGVNDDFPDAQLFHVTLLPTWYTSIGEYLSTGQFPSNMSPNERRKVVLRSRTFQLINGLLYKMGPDQILRRCVLKEEIPKVLTEAHEGPAGGHMGPDTTARKILLAGLWWPTVYNDAREWVVACDTCQRAGKPLKRDFMPLNPSHAQELFERWGLDFIGPLKVSKTRCRYIVVATEYLTKWVEARALPDNSAVSTAKFLYEQIITRYGIPIQLTSDRGGHFVNHIIRVLTTDFKIYHSLSSPYYPRANGQAEATNKILVGVIYKSCAVEGEDWEEKLPSALWAYRTSYKVTTGHTPFQLMYGQEAVVPTEFMVPSLRIAIENKLGDMESLRERLYNLNKLDERRLQAQWAIEVTQGRRKAWHDKHLKLNRFQPGQLVLKYNGRNEIRPGKFKVKWVGPFKIREVGYNGAIKLCTLDGKEIPDAVNGSKLKIYRERKDPAPTNN